MNEVEDVKKILCQHFEEDEHGIVRVSTPQEVMVDPCAEIAGYLAEEICQLFPPYPDAQWSDTEGECFWCKKLTHWVDICYEGYVCSQKCQQDIAQDVKSKSELKPNA